MAQCRKSNNQHAPSVAPVVFLLNGITLIIKLINLLKLYIHLVQPNWKIYCQLFYPQFTRKTFRRHKICVLLRCFNSMYARHMSFKSALPSTNFTPSDSKAANGENFSLSRQTKKAYRRICPLRITRKMKKFSPFEVSRVRRHKICAMQGA